MGEQLMTITLNGRDLTVTQVVAAARHGETVALAPEALAAMRRSRAIVQDVLAGGEPVYGLTTGVGERKAYLLDPVERQRFNHRLVLNHRIAQGDAAPADVVRGAMLCLANSYAKGVTGVRPELAEMIITLLNEGYAPPVRRLGSTALHLAYVAAGRFDGYWAFDNNPWDVAGAVVLIREAGGLVGDLEGNEGFLDKGEIVAANSKLFGALLKLLHDKT
jgi:histidine ammonia-lyase